MASSQKHPIRWLTHQQRVREDLLEAIRATHEADKPFFTEAYMASLAAPIKQQEEWILKLFLLQGTLLGFLALGFVSPDAKLSVFGFDLKNVEGLREILLAISATIALIIFGLSSSRDTAIFMLNVICEQMHPKSTLPFAKYVLPGPFTLRVYIPREYERWIFSKFPQKQFFAVIGLLFLTMFGIAITASFAIHWALIKDIWHHPGLGNWSIAALVYVMASYVIDLGLLANRWLPFPYKDESELKKKQDAARKGWRSR